jgi:hypothetical protein
VVDVCIDLKSDPLAMTGARVSLLHFAHPCPKAEAKAVKAVIGTRGWIDDRLLEISASVGQFKTYACRRYTRISTTARLAYGFL